MVLQRNPRKYSPITPQKTAFRGKHARRIPKERPIAYSWSSTKREPHMTTLEIILLGMALAMDAFAVTISNTFAYQGNSKYRAAAMPLAFGLLQGLMPVIGFFLGRLVSDVISQYAGILTFLILGVIGGKMIWDALHEDDGESSNQKLTFPVLLLQAIATSIDALAVGVSFAALSVDVVSAASIIAITTALCCTVALLIGRRFGNALGEKATIVGGTVLILIGIKALFM